VVAATPVDGATAVSVNTVVTFRFNEPVDDFYAMNSMRLRVGGTVVPARGAYDPSTYTAILTPLAPLSAATTYTAIMAAGVADRAGNRMPQDFVVSFTTAAGSTTTLGVTTIGGFEDNGDRNYLNGSKVTTNAAGQIASISVYVGAIDTLAANQRFEVGVYTDNGGRPGTLVARSATGTLVANAWNTVAIGAPLAANTTYWLMYNTNARGADVNNMRYTTGAAGQGAYSASSVPFGTWPATFPSAVITNYAFSLYATVMP
jgi:hypothetical protein